MKFNSHAKAEPGKPEAESRKAEQEARSRSPKPKAQSPICKPEAGSPNPGATIVHAKARGEWAELRFMTRATELGLRVAKPWGDSSPYDVATEHGGRFLRVQVKCTIFHRGNSYKCHLDSNGVPYSPGDIDIIAAYVIPTDTWYILPIRATNAQSDLLLTPHNPKAKYERYREAWHLLKT